MKFFTITTACFLLLFVSVAACHLRPQKKTDEKLTAVADSTVVKYQLVTDTIPAPVELLAPPDRSGRLFVCDLGGKIFILKNNHVLATPFIDLRTRLEKKDTTPNMHAIFSMAFHPDFASNKKFYVCYNAPATNKTDVCKLRIAEFKVRADNADVADLSSERPVFELEDSNAGRDDCEIAFGPDGYLYITTGAHVTTADAQKAQDLHSLLGKVLRIDVNKTPYAIPADNPFVDNKNAQPEIWAYGLRRVWRFSFDPKTHQLFGADVGDKLQEEIDILQKGGNYGWPIKEGDSLMRKNTTMDISKFITPLNTYTHKEGICVIGGSVYHGAQLAFLKDKYVFADYNGRLFSLVENTSGKWIHQSVKPLNPPADPLLIFSLDKDATGELYVLGVRNTQAGYKGVVYKLVHS